jgi:hypothetical protein
LFLTDNCHAWVLAGDGSYERLSPGDEARISAQEMFLEKLAVKG